LFIMVAPSTCPSASSLERLLAATPSSGELPVPSDEQTQLVLHLDHCTVCQRRLDDLAGANPALLEAARALRGNSFVNEAPLRRVIDELGNSVNLLTQYCAGDGRTVSRPPPLPPIVNLLGPLEDYEVTEVLGLGGMGQVLKAFDRALKRWVAIKALSPHLAHDSVSRLRFAREAQGAAAVRHENVITIHAVREANGLPYFIMEYVGGGSLQDYLDRDQATDWRAIARLGAEIAEGLAAAHAQGLIHRDIKPSNILLQWVGGSDKENPLRPTAWPSVSAELSAYRAKIGDFGIVRVADESRLTDTGLIPGTPMYMAPEQVRGEHLDARTDLFSLGSVLYTLCTGREPFRGDSPIAVIRHVSETTPQPIREINPAIPLWLAAVVERLHAKRRDERFASAAEVAQLLRYNLDHPDRPRIVWAGRPRSRERGHLRRAVLILATLLLLSGLLLGFSLYRRASDGSGTVNSERQATLTARAILHGHTLPIWSVAFSPDGALLATGSDDTTLRLWDPASGRQIKELSGHSGAVFAVAFAHSGKFLLSSDGDGDIRFWDIPDYKERPPLKHHTSNARRVVLSPDDKTVALANNIQGIELWNLDTLKLRQALPGHGGTILALAFAPDGQTLAVGDANGQVRLLDPNRGAEQARFSADPLGVRSLAFAPDSKTLASSGSRGMDIKLWDVASRQQSADLAGYDNSIMNLAYAPDGSMLAAGCRNGTVLLWDARLGQTLATVQAHQGAVWSVAFSPDGRTLASVGEDRLGKLWDLMSMK
jgi:serine/threonine protein kinase